MGLVGKRCGFYSKCDDKSLGGFGQQSDYPKIL